MPEDQKQIKFPDPKWIVAIVLFITGWVNLNHARWLKYDTIHQDVNNYYAYLPAFFYKHDLKLRFLDDTIQDPKEARYFWPNATPEGGHVIKYSMGMALTYLPFFAAAHVYCKLTGEEADGFSQPYHLAIQFSSMCYAALGFYFLVLILRSRFSRKTVWLTCGAIAFGTNLFYYMTAGAGMAHAPIFALLCLFLYSSLKWAEWPSWRGSLVCGLSLGLIVLIRPVNLVFASIPFLYGTSLVAFKTRFQFFIRHGLKLFLVIFLVLLTVLPQLVYWKYVTGSYFFNSYVGERFYFSQPHIFQGLLGFRKGWLIYTPMMWFALLGFIPLYKKHRYVFRMSLLILGLQIYIAFSWWCWWYGGSFGQRSMIDIYPVLAFPMAAFFDRLELLSKLWRGLSWTFLVFFLLLNIFQSMQAKRNVIHYDSMTAQAYFDGFFSLEEYPGRSALLAPPDYESARKGESEKNNPPPGPVEH